MASLEVWHGSERQYLEVPEGHKLTIGREDGNDFVVDDIRVSRTHANVFVESGRVFVEDLGSTNRTSVGEEEIRPWHPRPVTHNDMIDFGGACRARVILTPEEQQAERNRTVRTEVPTIRLTPSEQEVLDLLFMQYDRGQPVPQIASVQQIADERHTSAAAVKTILQQLYDKLDLDVRNKDELARRTVELGLTRRRG